MHIRILLETARIDDVVGAVPVHLAAGVYGTLIAGLTNGDASVGVQILGILAVGAFTFLAAFATWLLVQRVVGIRPARTEEEAGADPTEARFAGLIPSDELSLVPRALSGGLVVQDFKRFGTQITEILEECREDRSGEIASYIPQLARVDTEHFALGLCMVDGQLLSFGDDEERYCVQSTCKPVNYAVARDLLDREKVHRCSPACGARE